MALNHSEIERLFAKHMPICSCQAKSHDDGTTTLRFTHRDTHDTLTLDAMPDGQLQTERSIQRLCLTLEGEFTSLLARRDAPASRHG
ncbi:hypothetical protein TUM18999_35550 [Pseudomonas tohonis]|uniref:DUF1652 domain-containing protein n=1 Tax=Pseudomonas tohonis TaxID=2725477 RepID=A0A6J4E8S5_9PSED|nr:DUF1652 domain-containing protein [Pseudomonas tohonis]BCG25364.1 hypothetical protein TUM18999_35550 [Pseudomonas tohonis]GJN54806.1 hypothetical protein TUM20286_45580 [Pseudomonas tohonis]